LIAARPTWPNNGQIEKQQNSKTARHFPGSRAEIGREYIAFQSRALGQFTCGHAASRPKRQPETWSKGSHSHSHGQQNAASTMQHQLQFIKVFPATAPKRRNGAESKRPNGTDCAHYMATS